MQRISRLKRELQLLNTEPPPGIHCSFSEENLENIQAQIIGGSGTPFEGGVFNLEIKVPDRYPFEPPQVRFLTPIYHPNIDSAGRICLDALKLPPKGAWRPSLNISTVLSSIQLLMAEPNPDDPLMADISSEFKYSRAVYLEKARKWTEKYATQKKLGDGEEQQKGPDEERCGKTSRKREALSAQENLEQPKRSCS
ncbi:ubiquitin-conjugating enzyme E2 T [Astyanax mexicanus]|uniref:Ubiquitin-conjugating enzyme E2 T n=1 Tax=Astyanax mexicanus TaxID=7994 RepID=A0A8B9J589_ASTMX|nr:ubiquitin-conjugating enzyme E2 T [Astyanax mexicanus]KAG9269923.1 ubiquitin-conjugating enzyme E2 T [Astyanax mexicanus]